jgi:hypothetical protein
MAVKSVEKYEDGYSGNNFCENEKQVNCTV